MYLINMKMIFLVIFYFVGTTIAAPTEPEVTIVEYNNENDGLGSYKFNFETSDGSKRMEEGVLKNAEDPENAFVAVSGSFSYIGPDGVTYTVTYTADENGFQPIGDHIPLVPNAQLKAEDSQIDFRKNAYGKK